ncbi:hypothetical protein Acr_00g0015330 [Actinidia rufa]|uniref:Reverse transcriptase zinc-binding domain-containing protein n=1 Tax=Actinidia rufa TaxID=165716 RepID=A0A7J0DCD6_9ERIC|nr:hypothetical protein Acr_00g0015330 [Actinidia rufa]
MPKYFSFGKEAISSFLVWVQLRDVPLTLWNPMVFGKICFKLGRPLHMDKLTTRKEKVTYARCLVEVDLDKELIHFVMLHFKEGGEHEQRVFYENLPKFCSHCRKGGHNKENYKANPSKIVVIPIEGGKNADTQAMPNAAGESKKSHLEWVVKQTAKGFSVAEEVVNPEPTTVSNPENLCTKRSLAIPPESTTVSNPEITKLKHSRVLLSEPILVQFPIIPDESSTLPHLVAQLGGGRTNLNFDFVSGGRKLDPGQAKSLTQQVTEEDIKLAFFTIGEDKTPGLDGYTSCFFKKTWDIVGPYFIAAVMEFFSSGCFGDLKNNPNFNFHPRCGGLKITHLTYADDLILLSRGDPTSVSLIMGKLNHFGDCSGLKISISKSSLFPVGINSRDLEAIKEITGFAQGVFSFKYLGISVAASRLTIAQFSPLNDKVSDCISVWAGTSLSYTGRTELIKSVLQAVECYWLSILPIPVGVRKKITQLCRNFLWNGKATVNKKPLVAWKDVCLPKHEGGLGIRNTKAWNKALICKTLWDIQAKKDSLWVQWIHQIYMNQVNFWEYRNRHEDSPFMKQIIISLRDEIIEEEGLVGNAILRLNQWAPEGYLLSRLAYEFFRLKRAKNAWSKMVWHNSITPKDSFILWLRIKDRLRTRDKLRDFVEDLVCPLCMAENEDIDHLFFQCRVWSHVWGSIKIWLGITRAMNTLKAAIKWMIKESRGTGFSTKFKRISLACMIYHIWGATNKRIFEDKIEQPEEIIRRI